MERIHIGSIEEVERKRKLEEIEHGGETNKKYISGRGLGSGEEDLETINQRSFKEALHTFGEDQLKKKQRLIFVPKDDTKVMEQLRTLREPVCYYGEGPTERRDRLKKLLDELDDNRFKALGEIQAAKKQSLQQGSSMNISVSVTPTASVESPFSSPSIGTKLNSLPSGSFLSEGIPELALFRKEILTTSLSFAAQRLANEKITKSIPIPILKASRQKAYQELKGFAHIATQIGGDRPVSYCSISPDGAKLVATASWSADCKLWHLPNLNLSHEFKGHKDRVTCIEFHPESGIRDSGSPTGLHLASSDVSGVIHLWSKESAQPIGSLSGHALRVSRVAFHPFGKHLGSTSHDTSWRLWDLESKVELLLQEGHSKEVICIAFQSDGALVATGGMDANGIIWDLRCGKPISTLRGHVGTILGVDFSKNGYEIATGSEDHSVKIWDLRQRACQHTLYAHSDPITSVKYHPNESSWILTTSIDKTAKIWGVYDWKPLTTLSGHDGKILHGDMTKDGNIVITAGYDRTFKLWSCRPGHLSST